MHKGFMMIPDRLQVMTLQSQIVAHAPRIFKDLSECE